MNENRGDHPSTFTPGPGQGNRRLLFLLLAGNFCGIKHLRTIKTVSPRAATSPVPRTLHQYRLRPLLMMTGERNMKRNKI